MGQIISAILDDRRIPDHNDYLDHHQDNLQAFRNTYGNIIEPPLRSPQPAAAPPPAPPSTATRRSGSIGSYNRKQRILVVGDGDLSFSASLTLAFGSAPNLVATTLDSLEFLKEHYMWSIWNIKELKGRGSKVLHGVDATQMASHPELCNIKFDRIIFNFPLAGFFDRTIPRELQIQVNQGLVGGFLANAKKLIEEDGEIHVTHKAYGFYKQWNLEKLARSQGLWLKEVADFQRTDYPGYHTKYGFGGDKDFDCSNSKTYKFMTLFGLSKQSIPMNSSLWI